MLMGLLSLRVHQSDWGQRQGELLKLNDHHAGSE
jgi:hypothetical protein